MRIAILIISSYLGCSAGVFVIFCLALSDIPLISVGLLNCELCDSGNLRHVVSIASFLLLKVDRRENKPPKVTNIGCYSAFVSCKCLEINSLAYPSFPLEYLI